MFIRSIKRSASRFKALFGIRARLVLLALILVLPLMLDRVRLLEENRTKQVVQVTKELSELAQHTADAQREIISTVQAVLKSSAYIYAAAAQQGRGCAVLRASLRVDLPWISSLNLLDKNGIIRCSTRSSFVGFDLHDRDYFRRAMEFHEFTVSDYIVARTNGMPAIVAAYPVSAIDGGEEAVVMASVDLDWMAKLFANRGHHSGVTIDMVDGKGTVLAVSPGSANVVGQPLRDMSLLETVSRREIDLDREFGSISFLAGNGQRQAISFARVTGTRARMIVGIDEAVMLADIDRDIRTAYLQLGLVGLLALLGAWLAGEILIVRPVRALTDTANRFGRGDFSVRASKKRLPHEFVPLAHAFNSMARELSERDREMAAANDRLTVMASHDLVSGLANRRGFQSRLEFEWMKALQHDSQLSVLMIDVDHFKLFNDTFGHPEGDACLSRVGEVLAMLADIHGGFAARYGGEEFCLLLPDSDPAYAVTVAERVRAHVEDMAIPHVTGPGRKVTVSVGVATVAPGAAQPQDDLIEAADAALYTAKRRGRNAVAEHGLSKPGRSISLAG